jgi:hypothetical protein
MGIRIIWLILLAVFSEAVPSDLAQTPLAQVFADLRSSDTAKVRKARDDIFSVLEQEFPTIEKDAPTICGALSDPDPYIRLQATAILSTVVQLAPSHNQLILACVPGLLVTAKDSVDNVRENSLFALAMNPAGPPPQAHQAFQDALESPDMRSVENGAAGLIRESDGKLSANHELVAKALSGARDSQHKVSLLNAMYRADVKSQTLFDAARSVLADPDPEVEQAAVYAIAASSPNDAAALGVLQNMKASASTAPEVRTQIDGAISIINRRR